MGLCIVHVPFWHVPVMATKDSGIKDNSKQARGRVQRQLNAQQRDERQQGNSNSRRLARQHLSNSLHSTN